MGQDVNNDSRFCQIPPGPKKSLNWLLKLRTIPKKDLNWYLPKIIFVAMSLIIILISGLAYYYYFPLWEYPWWAPELRFGPVALLLISFAQIITLSAVWKMLSGIIETYNLKPNSIYVAMILLFFLLSGRAYYYMAIMVSNCGNFLVIMLLEIIMLAVGSIYLSGVRQPNKTKTERWAIPQQRLSDGKWIFPVVPDELVARCDQSVISVFHEAYPHVKEEYDPTWFMEPVISGGPAISGGQ